MSKVIMVVLDGLKYDVAVSSMGFMYHLIEKEKAALYKVKSEMPSLSRPLYEVLLTGTPAWMNGITSNQTVRLSRQKSIFHICREHGLRTAAAAYFWVSELYQRAPFDYLMDREQHDESKPIQHGKFYFDDTYPDSHLFADAEYLRRTYDPHFLYIHPMNIDDTGHKFTCDSAQYRNRAMAADNMLSLLVPNWMTEGYEIIVTADHGMNRDGNHGGSGDDERDVPLFCIGNRFEPGFHDVVIAQLGMAPLVCEMLGVPPSDVMVPVPIKHNFK
ncbi:alkaline phosphatase family protein [Paenibacillus cisolokensis]|uniref:alkaline phosphatase family protein n=1 Tax=Paenibacillus cisolokensis TaxID=1658519 RepID=UPI003D2AC607